VRRPEAGSWSWLNLLGRQLGLGGVQRLVGQDRVLDQQISGVRIAPHRLLDHGVGLRVLGRGRCGRQIGQEGLQEGAFVGSHRASPIRV
jgi:hypothetical protein